MLAAFGLDGAGLDGGEVGGEGGGEDGGGGEEAEEGLEVHFRMGGLGFGEIRGGVLFLLELAFGLETLGKRRERRRRRR